MSDAPTLADIAAVIYRYSTAMDTRQWHLMDDVFAPDAVCDMGGMICNGRQDIVRFIKAAIECCAGTHHLNTNIEADISGDTARVTNKFSAWHRGKDAHKDTLFLALGTYEDEFVRATTGWRIQRRTERTQLEAWLDASNSGNMAEFFAAAFGSQANAQ